MPKKLPPKNIIFRGYKKFNKQNVLYDLYQEMFKEKF